MIDAAPVRRSGIVFHKFSARLPTG